MEETQLLWDPDQRDPRGRLRILTGGQQAESALDQFMVYEGLNVIGRDENCHIHIPVQSVSRRHAVIEVEGDSHVIRDCDSLNSTWRKKVFLKPHVRYDINDGDLFLFGDVACQYQVLPPAVQGSDSGSETGSESVLPQIGAGEGAESDPIAQAGNSDAELTGDSLVVSPTPAHQRSRLPAQVAQPDVHVKESEDDDTPWKGSRSLFSRPCQDPSTSVCQTPSANIVPESDDEAENVSRSSAEATRLHYGSDTDLEEDQYPGEESAEQSTEQPADGIDPLPEAAVNGDTGLGDLSAAEEGASSEPGDRVVQENGDLPSQRPVTPPPADTGDSYALEPTQCFILNVSSSQDEMLAEENCITPGDPVNTHSPEEDDTQTFDFQAPLFSKEPSQSGPVAQTSGTESVAEPPVSEAAETVLPPHRGESEPREEGGPGPEDQELLANEETQLFCAEHWANGEEERAGNANRPPVLTSPDSPPGTEGWSVAEPPASPGPSAAADGGERGTISPEHGDVVIPATAEASPPGLVAEADTREPGPETPATGQTAGSRGRGRLQRSETRQRAETSPAQMPTGPRRGNCRQPTTSDHPRPLEESPQPAAKGKAKHRTVASPQGAAEVPPETPSPSQQRTWGRSRRKLVNKEPSQSDPVVRTSGTESVAEPPASEAAETVLPPHRGGSEPREEGGPGPEDQEHWADEETQLFCAEQRANGEEEEERAGIADRPPVPPSPDSPPGTEGGSVAEPPASPGSSAAADGGEMGTISSEHGDVVNPATAEASLPGLETEADTQEPGPETLGPGRAAGRRGRGRLQRSETRQRAGTSPAQTPTGPRRGNCRQQTSPQPTASDHPRPLEEGPQPAAKGKAKHRTVASPQGAAEVPPETPSPSQQRTWGRSRRKLVNKEPSQSDTVARTSGTESVAEPSVSESAETVLPTHRGESEPREEGGPGPEDQEHWANEETQLFCAEHQANEEEEEERAGNADRPPAPPSPDSPPGTEGGSVAEPPASPGPSAAAGGGERGTILPEHGDVVIPATAEASPPGLVAEADTREPETLGPGQAAGRRGRRRLQRRETRQPAETSPGGAEVALETQSPSQKRTRGRSRRKQECTQPCLQETEMPCGQLPDAGDASAPPQMKTRRRTCQPSPSSSLASLSESPAASKRSETTTVQTPARPRRGNCRQQTSPQPTASDHPRPLEESPQLAARGKAKRRTAASPPGGAEVPPETPSPSQQRARGRSRRKQECTQPSSQETDTAAGRLRSSGAGSQPDSEKDASAPPQMKTRRQTCQPSPSSSLATQSESPTAPKVMFTGLVDEEGMEVIRQLGGEVVESVYDSTHLVANRIRRTVKFMCAVARGIPVVTSEWLKQSGKNRYYLSPRSFLLGDREQEQKFNFSLRDAIHKAKEQRLLQDYRIHVTPGVQPDPSQMATILQCCGATVLPKMPRANKEKTLVISCPSDLPKCKAALNANIPVVGVEFALTGILQQAVDLGKYRLDGDEVSHGQPQGKGRRLQSPEAPVTGGKRKKR